MEPADRTGEVVGAALVAHVPTIVLPEATRRELNDGEEISLVPGLHRMKSEQLDRLRPDTIVVFDAHWHTTVEFVVAAHARRAGLYTSEELPRGMCRMPYDFPGDPELAHADRRRGDGRRFVDDADRRPVPPDPLPDDEPPAVPPGRRAVGQREHGPDRRERRLPARRRGHRAGRRPQRAASRAAGQRRHEPHVLEAAGAPRSTRRRTPSTSARPRPGRPTSSGWVGSRTATTPGWSTRCRSSSGTSRRRCSATT